MTEEEFIALFRRVFPRLVRLAVRYGYSQDAHDLAARALPVVHDISCGDHLAECAVSLHLAANHLGDVAEQLIPEALGRIGDHPALLQALGQAKLRGDSGVIGGDLGEGCAGLVAVVEDRPECRGGRLNLVMTALDLPHHHRLRP